MFPITYKNRFIYKVQGDPRWVATRLREHFAQSLAKEGARQITVEDMVICFNGVPWYWKPGWRFPYAISKGKITVDYQDERVGMVCQISFVNRIILCLVLMGFVGFMEFVLLGTSFWLGLRYFVMALLWFGLFIGGEIVVDRYRYNRFVQHHLREFFDSSTRFGVQGELITPR